MKEPVNRLCVQTLFRCDKVDYIVMESRGRKEWMQ